MPSARVIATASFGVLLSCIPRPKGVETNPAGKTQQAPREEFDDKISANSKDLFERGRTIFRWDTFGSEAFWGGKLQLHRAILGQKLGGAARSRSPDGVWHLRRAHLRGLCPDLPRGS